MEFKDVYGIANYLKSNNVSGFSLIIDEPFVIVLSYCFDLADLRLLVSLTDCGNLLVRIDSVNGYCRAKIRFV